jgi:hypothetical protein
MTSLLARAALAATLLFPLAAAARAAEPAVDADPSTVRRITPEEVQRRRDAGEKPIILDTRGSQGDTVIRGAVHVPNDRIAEWAKDARKNAFVVAYCT